MTGAGAGQKVAWFNCFSGIAGDMTLGSLVDAGADIEQLLRLLAQLPIGGWSLDFEPVTRAGLACTRAIVDARGDSVVRTWMHIQGVLTEARLPDRVRDLAMAAFEALAEAEGRVHRRPAALVRFHEVGGHDTIVDIVGSAAGLYLLEVDAVAASPIATGTGVVRSAHGLLPNPAPAVVDLLRGIPAVGRDLNVELTTPTGAAMMKAWGYSFGPMPAMTVEATGYGAGSREIDGMPNCTQVVLGLGAAVSPDLTGQPHEDATRPLSVLEANLDDATGETLAHAVEVLLEDGALDAWITPVVTKKGRPAHLVTVLSDPALVVALAGRLRAETGTLGVRVHEVSRHASHRQLHEVEVDGVPIRVKVSPGRVKAEHADVARAARRLGKPLLEIAAKAEAAWRSSTDDDAPRRAPRPTRPKLAELPDPDPDPPASA
jgi:uncharacterized protein (TIGR00299 family) protein